MRRLLSSEFLRFRSRRLIVVLLGASLGGSGLGAVIAAWQSTPPTETVLAAAQAEADEQFRLCMNDFSGEDVEGSLEAFCRENVGNATYYMPSHLALVELPQILEGISSLTSILGLVIGASFVAASWQTGTISTIFTWEPRRLRWFAARILVLAIGVFVMTALIVAFLSGGLALAAMLRGSTAGVDGAWGGDVLSTWLRVALAASISGVIGGAVAAVGRHTSAALGVVFLWTAVIEGVVRGLRPLWTPWLLGDNLVSFLGWQRMEVQFGPFESYTITPGRAVFVIVGYAALTLALGFTFVRVRDVQ
jgi:ABC-2 type transport system permease protein